MKGNNNTGRAIARRVRLAAVLVLAGWLGMSGALADDGAVHAAFGKKGVVVTVEIEFGEVHFMGREPVAHGDGATIVLLPVPAQGLSGLLAGTAAGFDQQGAGLLGQGDGAEPPGSGSGSGITSFDDQAFYAEVGPADDTGAVTVTVYHWHDGQLHEIAAGVLD